MGYTRVKKADGSCCECADQVGCVCEEGTPCANECRSKAGFAQLCGEVENGTPSVPPKFYRRRRTTGGMDICHYPAVTDCSLSSPTNTTVSDSHTDGAHNASVNGQLAWTAYDAGSGTWTARISVTAWSRDTGESQPTWAIFVFVGGTNAYGPPEQGANFADISGLVPGATIVFGTYLAFSTNPSDQTFTNVTVPGAPPSGVHDEYDDTLQHDPEDCSLSQVDVSYRTISAVSCPVGGGEIDPGGVAGIGGYGSDAPVSVISATKRRAVGTGSCVAASPDSDKTTGTVTEELSDEDTDEAAIQRASAAIAEWTPCGCLFCPAFATERGAGQDTLAYRRTQVRGLIGPNIMGYTYAITIGYFRRVLGSSGPWIFFAIDEPGPMTVTTEEQVAILRTEWLDVPNEAGFETRAQTCAVEETPP